MESCSTFTGPIKSSSLIFARCVVNQAPLSFVQLKITKSVIMPTISPVLINQRESISEVILKSCVKCAALNTVTSLDSP